MRRWIVASLAALAVLASVPASAQQPADDDDGQGVKVRRTSLIRKLVSAEKIEKAALEQYDQLRSQAVSRNALLPADDAQARRVQRIADDLLPFTRKWHEDAKSWKWDVIVVKSPTINALCMPGGKIAVFTGLLDGLKLTDDEVAVVLGHEMAHALREHARARAAKITLTNVGALAVGLVIGGNVGEIARQSPQRQAAKRTPPTWLSTHPSGEDRMRRTKAALPQVMPLHQKAKANRPPAPAAPN